MQTNQEENCYISTVETGKCFEVKYKIYRLYLILSGRKRTEYMKKKEVFFSMGDNCLIMDRIIPLFVVSSLSIIFIKTLSDNGFIIFITFLSKKF